MRRLVVIGGLALFGAGAVVVLSGRPDLRHRIEHVASVDDPQFASVMESLMGAALTDGNDVKELSNGEEIFPAMLEAIRAAERTITFESYIYWSGDIGRQFSEALAERARANVKVHVLIDSLGSSKADQHGLDTMEQAGVQVRKYNPVRLTTLLDMNNRTHRKLLVVDGRVGFTGGVGIADKWSGHGDSPEHWRDAHFRVAGPTVSEMQATFMDNWVEVMPDVHHDEAYFPLLSPVGTMRAQIVHSAPDGGSLKIRLMYGLFVGGARRTLRIANAYFVPEDAAIEEIAAASRRGVQVELIVPGKIIDSQVTRKASHGKWGPLLEAGVAIYEFQPTMYHCKVMIVDDLWVSVGSTNFDNRSFRINDEANLNVRDSGFAKRQAQIFEQDKQKSRRVTLAEWQQRGFLEKAEEAAADMFDTQL
jgi:cardiolipin synthase